MIEFTFKTQGGDVVRNIDDDKLESFILATQDMRDQYGERPEHPIDFCSIAYKLYINGKIKEDFYRHCYDKMVEIFKSF